MANLVSIVLKAREERGKEKCKKLRSEGIPCVFYGPEYVQSIPCTANTVEMTKLANSRWETQALDATLPNGKKEMCLIREIQKDPISRQILHVDFLQLVKGHKISVNVPVHIVGRDKCPGVKAGGVIEHILREIEMEVLPSSIPEMVTVDVSDFELGHQFHVKDLAVPEGAEILVDADEIVITVAIPRSVVEEEAEAVVAEGAEEVKEVEVVAKGKAKNEEEEQ
ncbi:MAG TPA: 50S ribosomal protein L25 [Synergistaceae bacterium]|jgi:large subunit ribosomal protein L25|nr:50S ribosomal protein L25 [Synergistaceae bacterium]